MSWSRQFRRLEGFTCLTGTRAVDSGPLGLGRPSRDTHQPESPRVACATAAEPPACFAWCQLRPRSFPPWLEPALGTRGLLCARGARAP